MRGASAISGMEDLIDMDWNYERISVDNFDGLMKERLNSCVLVMEVHLSCINPSIYDHDNDLWVTMVGWLYLPIGWTV